MSFCVIDPMFDERNGYRHDNALALESETISVLIVVSEANASRDLVAGLANDIRDRSVVVPIRICKRIDRDACPF
jgi:hypothetical protein